MKYDTMKAICSAYGTTVSGVVRKAGYSSSIADAWKNGREPKLEQLVVFANILGINAIDFIYMIINETTDNPHLIPSDNETELTAQPIYSEDEYELLNLFKNLSRKDKHRFMAMVYEFKESEN